MRVTLQHCGVVRNHFVKSTVFAVALMQIVCVNMGTQFEPAQTILSY